MQRRIDRIKYDREIEGGSKEGGMKGRLIRICR